MSLPFGPPQPVSPLIRGMRFALLIAGIIYARGKQTLYNSLEAKHREEEAKKKIIRDKELAMLRAKIAREERETVRLFETGKLFEPGVMDGGTGGEPPPSEPEKACPNKK